MSSPTPKKGNGGEAQSLRLAICSPFNLPQRLPPRGGAFCPAVWRGAKPVTKAARGGSSGLRLEAGSTPRLAGGGPDGARTATLSPSRRWRLQPSTCPHTSSRAPRVSPLRPGFCSLATGPRLLPRGDTCARGARPAPPGAEHGLPHSSGSGSQHPPARAPQEPPRPGRCHLPQPSWCPSPPQPGYTRVGAADGSRPAGTHRALCRRRSRLPAAPRARLHLSAGARPLGAARAPPPVLGPLAASGSLSWPPRPLRPADHSPAPSPHPRSPRVFPACPASRPCMGQ